MRILTRKIYRAFPELDPYDDAQCRRFIRAARSSFNTTLLHLAAILAVTLPLLAAGLAGTLYLSDRLRVFDFGLDGFNSWRVFALVGGSAVLLGAGPVAGALVRDVLLRRRLRFVLRTRGACPTCHYSLVGLQLSARSTVLCPECGVEVEVDPSLGELSREGTGRILVSGVATDAQVFWTPARRRILKRAALVAAVLLFGVLPTVSGLYELRVRSQSATARRDLPALQAALTRMLPPAASGPDAWEILDRAATLMNQADGPAWRNALDSDPTQVYPEFTFLVRADRVATETFPGETPERNRAAAELARVMIGLYAKAGVPEVLRELEACRQAPIAPELLDGSPLTLPRLYEPLGTIRRIARMNSGRLAVAAAAGDRPEFLAAVESTLALARLVETNPIRIHALTGISLESLVYSNLRHWVRSPDFHPEWIPELQQVLERQQAPLRPDLVMEAWHLEERLEVARFFSVPANIRFGSYSGPYIAMTSTGFGGPPTDRLSLASYPRNSRAVDDIFRAIAPSATREPSARTGFSPAADASFLGLVAPTRVALTTALFPFDRTNAERRGLALLLALERYRAAHGDYPPNLAALTPADLASLPLDPWSGASFVYRKLDPATDPDRRRFTLYSVGPDGKDDGGQGIQAAAAFLPGPDLVVNDPNE